jgi:hypothetical protein
VVAIAAARGVAADPCAPTAVVTGEPEVVNAVEQRLSERGVATRASADCPFVRAEVAMLGSEVLTSIDDGDGRHSERVMASPQVAATLIESWTRFDLAGDLLGPPEPYDDGAGESTSDLQPPAPASQVVFEDEVSPDAREPREIWLRLAPEATAGSNRSTLFGARASLCGQVGKACVGALVRFGYDPGLTGNSATLQTTRTALDGLLIFDFPLEWSGVALVPGIGVGGGWSRSSRYIPCDDDDCDEEDTERNEVTGDVDEDEGGVRFEVHALLAFALTEGLSLDLSLAVGLSALGQYGSYPYDDAHIAGEPRATLRGGVGLGYGF